ncbi:hypothetical protein ARTHRO9AX_220317 [Arthrobacter sp. 9AX]|uniref:hypothetical protein n=1 Tax=Arthrobacter sp. 9AX TaxID=2653131 RepID=UPI0012F38CA5|nr:hypothetical protein [Arthrobacter sp. 9AX]VXC23722.1 hypothetical protein ARTHRO9AX_220317 [Arthrobacter sp. 9AX]
MNQSGFQALKLLTEAGRLWNTWRSLDDSSKQALKVEGIELKEAVSDARRASTAALQRTRTSLRHKGLSKRRAQALDPSSSSQRFQKILEVMGRSPHWYWSTEEISQAISGQPKTLSLTLTLALLRQRGLLIQNAQKRYKYKTRTDRLGRNPDAHADKMVTTFLQEYVDACIADGFIEIDEKGLPTQKTLGLDEELLKSVVGSALEQGFREGLLCLYDIKGASKIIIGLPPESLESFEPTTNVVGQEAPSLTEAASRLAKASQKLTLHLRELQGTQGLGFGKPMPEIWNQPQGNLDWSPDRQTPQTQSQFSSDWEPPFRAGPLPPTKSWKP